MRERGYASWERAQRHMGRSGECLGTVQMSCRCTGGSMGEGKKASFTSFEQVVTPLRFKLKKPSSAVSYLFYPRMEPSVFARHAQSLTQAFSSKRLTLKERPPVEPPRYQEVWLTPHFPDKYPPSHTESCFPPSSFPLPRVSASLYKGEPTLKLFTRVSTPTQNPLTR
nr:hypothetical protein [Tanacetum cinerariifolium]